VSLWLIGIVCVKGMESPQTVFFFVVRLLVPFEMFFFSRFGLSWVMPRRVVDLYGCWWTADDTQNSAMWKMLPSCLLWCLWRERNNRRFEDREKTLEEIKSLFFNTLYLWTTAYVYHLGIN